MFREIRRPNQLLSHEEAVKILESCSTGVLAVSGDGGYPYAVPLNYVYDGGKLYFHCALEGHKIDGIKNNDKVSFCVIEKDDVDAKAMNTDYFSVIVFGKAKVLSGDRERREALELLARKYSADFKEETQTEIKNEWDNVALVEINIEHTTGKKGSGLL